MRQKRTAEEREGAHLLGEVHQEPGSRQEVGDAAADIIHDRLARAPRAGVGQREQANDLLPHDDAVLREGQGQEDVVRGDMDSADGGDSRAGEGEQGRHAGSCGSYWRSRFGTAVNCAQFQKIDLK